LTDRIPSSAALQPVDLHQVIRQLLAERARVISAIEVLESYKGTSDLLTDIFAARKGRGRKSMTSNERRQVSERMKLFWAKRRQTPRKDGANQARAERRS